MQSHKTVLIREAVEALALNETSVAVDATLGAGGHASAITDILGDSGIFIYVLSYFKDMLICRSGNGITDLSGSNKTVYKSLVCFILIT